MRYKIWIVLAVITAVFFLGCKGGSGSSKTEENFGKDASYAVGLNIGSGMKEGMTMDGVYPNIDELLKGMRDGLTGKNPRFSLDEARHIIETTLDAVFETKEAESEARPCPTFRHCRVRNNLQKRKRWL